MVKSVNEEEGINAGPPTGPQVQGKKINVLLILLTTFFSIPNEKRSAST